MPPDSLEETPATYVQHANIDMDVCSIPPPAYARKEAFAPPTHQAARSGGGRSDRCITLYVLAAATCLLFSLENAHVPHMSSIASDLGILDKDRDTKIGGQLSSVFYLVGAALSLVNGALADTANRTRLLGVTMLLGAMFAVLAAAATDFTHLLIARVGLGVVLTGFQPVAYSLVGDIVTPPQRAGATTLIGTCVGAGLLAGQVLSGTIAFQVGGWRGTFLLLSVPTALAGLACLVLFAEPKRSDRTSTRKPHVPGSAGLLPAACPGSSSSRPTFAAAWTSVRAILRVRTNALVFLQAIPGSAPWAVVFVFLSDFFAVDKGVGVRTATSIAVLYGVGAGAGALLGGLVGAKLRARGVAMLPKFMGVCSFLAVVPMVSVLHARLELGQLNLGFVLAIFFGGLLSNVSGNNLRVLLLDCNLPSTRGSVFAMFNLVNAVGRSTGPLLAAALITLLGSRARAFSAVFLCWLISGSIVLLMSLTVERDCAAVKHALEDESPDGLSSLPRDISVPPKSPSRRGNFSRMSARGDDETSCV